MATVVNPSVFPAPKQTQIDPFASTVLQAMMRKSELEKQREFDKAQLLTELQGKFALEDRKTQNRIDLEEFKSEEALRRGVALEELKQTGRMDVEQLKAARERSLEELRQVNRLDLEAAKAGNRKSLEELKAELGTAGGGATEKERDVESTIQTIPVLRDMDPAESRPIARRIINQGPEALRQLESDFKTQAEEGLAVFPTAKSRIEFEQSRKHLETVMAEGVTDIGEAVQEAKRRGQEGVKRLEFLPEDIQRGIFTQDGLRRDPQLVLDDLERTVDILMDDTLGLIEFQGRPEMFDEAIKMLRRRVAIGDRAVEELRRRVVGVSTEE